MAFLSKYWMSLSLPFLSDLAMGSSYISMNVLNKHWVPRSISEPLGKVSGETITESTVPEVSLDLNMIDLRSKDRPEFLLCVTWDVLAEFDGCERGFRSPELGLRLLQCVSIWEVHELSLGVLWWVWYLLSCVWSLKLSLDPFRWVSCPQFVFWE